MTKTWINQPGDYTGDVWHIAAALYTTNCHVVQTASPNNTKESDRAEAFYKNLGFGNRVTRLKVESDLYADLKPSNARDRATYNQRNIEHAATALRVAQESVLPVYQATKLALPHLAGASCRKSFANDMTNSFARDNAEAADTIRRMTTRIESHSLIAIGRYAKYHTNFNCTGVRLRELVRLASVYDRKSYLFATKTNASGDTSAPQIPLLDIYETLPHCNIPGTNLLDLRAVAYFWRQIADSGKDVLVVGGRSGTVDAAAFAGMNVVEWDSFSSSDPESYRLLSMSPLLCSTLEVPKTGFCHRVPYEIFQTGGIVLETTDAQKMLKHAMETPSVRFRRYQASSAAFGHIR